MLREFFPAAMLAFDDLDAPDTLELPGRAPDPVSAARLSTTQITATLKRAHRRDAAPEPVVKPESDHAEVVLVEPEPPAAI